MINEKHPDIDDLAKSLNPEQLSEFKTLIKDIARFFPTELLFSDYGSMPESFGETDLTDDELEERALKKMMIHSKDFSVENYTEKFKKSEPFVHYTKSWLDFVEKNYAKI